MPDIVAQKFRNSVHHFEHPWDDILQKFCLFAGDFICNLVRQKQNALQPIEKARRHLVVFSLFFQELNGQCGVYTSDTLVLGSTNLKRDAGHTEECLCDWIQLKLVSIWEN